MYAATQWTPLPTGHGPLGLASLKKGQVTPTGGRTHTSNLINQTNCTKLE